LCSRSHGHRGQAPLWLEGAKVTIKGTNFDGTTAVKFGTKKAKKFKVISDTKSPPWHRPITPESYT